MNHLDSNRRLLFESLESRCMLSGDVAAHADHLRPNNQNHGRIHEPSDRPAIHSERSSDSGEHRHGKERGNRQHGDRERSPRNQESRRNGPDDRSAASAAVTQAPETVPQSVPRQSESNQGQEQDVRVVFANDPIPDPTRETIGPVGPVRPAPIANTIVADSNLELASVISEDSSANRVEQRATGPEEIENDEDVSVRPTSETREAQLADDSAGAAVRRSQAVQAYDDGLIEIFPWQMTQDSDLSQAVDSTEQPWRIELNTILDLDNEPVDWMRHVEALPARGVDDAMAGWFHRDIGLIDIRADGCLPGMAPVFAGAVDVALQSTMGLHRQVNLAGGFALARSSAEIRASILAAIADEQSAVEPSTSSEFQLESSIALISGAAIGAMGVYLGATHREKTKHQNVRQPHE